MNKITPEQREEMLQMYLHDKTPKYIAAAFNISLTTVYKYVRVKKLKRQLKKKRLSLFKNTYGSMKVEDLR